MSATLRILAIIAALAMSSGVLSGCSDKPPETAKNLEFSATLVSNYGKTQEVYNVYFSGRKVRLDMVSPDTGTFILRKDLGVNWTLMPKMKVFLEIPIRPEHKNPLVFSPDKILEYDRLGEEVVDGRTLYKEKVIIQNEGDKEKEFYRWFDVALGWPVKAEDTEGKWTIELKDIKQGPQDPELFEIPAGYRKIVPSSKPVILPR